MPTHVVKQGDCFANIADRYGVSDPLALYDHPLNAELKEKRKSPFVLLPGDAVVIPEREEKWVDRATGKRHEFTWKRPVVMLRVVVRDGAAPLAGKRYLLRLDGVADVEGQTGGDGLVEQPVAASAARAELFVFVDGAATEDEAVKITLRLGHLDPVDSVSGVQARLRNVGVHCPVSGSLCDDTRAAVSRFQEREGLEVTGNVDDGTRARLLAAHEGT